MTSKVVRGGAIAAAILIGMLPAFFLVFGGVFSDGPRSLVHPERLLSLGLVVGAYAFLAAAFAWFVPMEGWRWGLWVSLAAVMILVWYASREPQAWLLHAIYATAASGGGATAAWATARAQRRRGAIASTPPSA